MSNEEKLRALLAEARMYLTMNGGSADDRIVRSIDAALAEPVAEESLYGIREDRDSLRVEAKRLERERDEARAERGELLAIIHRDGGHYVGQHGVTKAVADAHATWAAVVRERDEARAEVERLQKALEEALDLAEEGWSYADDLYKTKWKYAQRLAALRPPKEGP